MFFCSLHSSFSSFLLIPKKYFALLGLRTLAHDLLFTKTSPQITHLLQMTLYSFFLQISARPSSHWGSLSWPPPDHYLLPHALMETLWFFFFLIPVTFLILPLFKFFSRFIDCLFLLLTSKLQESKTVYVPAHPLPSVFNTRLAH